MLNSVPAQCHNFDVQVNFQCILMSRFWNLAALHFNFAFPSIYQAFEGQTKSTQLFNFVFFKNPSCEIRENFTQAKTTWFTVIH